jgi:hypothetical protein
VKTQPAPDIVEMIDDDRDAFGDHPSSQPVRNTRWSPRWVGPAAAAALIAVVGYGVVSSAIGSNSTATRPNAVEPQYYLADPPPGFDLYMAEQRGDAGTAADFPAVGPAQLWATVDASATSGAWFVVSLGSHHSTSRNSYRTTVDGIGVVIERDPTSRQARLAFTKDGHALEITALGWLDRQLVRLVRSISLDDSAIHFSNEFFTTDHRRILDADPAEALFGRPVARVGYAAGFPSELADIFTITVARDNVVDRKKVAKFTLVNTTSFTVDDMPAIIGQLAADPTVSIAQWRDGQRLITMRGNFDADRLQAIAETVHTSSNDKVHDQLEGRSTQTIEAVMDAPETIVSGIQVSKRDPDDPAAGYLWWIGQPGDSTKVTTTLPSLPSGAPTIETFVEHDRTYVLAKVPRGITGAQLHVNPTGFPSTVTPLFDVDPNLADQFAAAVFSEAVPFTAQIVDGDGQTVASWPTF